MSVQEQHPPRGRSPAAGRPTIARPYHFPPPAPSYPIKCRAEVSPSNSLSPPDSLKEVSLPSPPVATSLPVRR